MIRGAMILAVGFSLGYVKALHEQDDIREDLSAVLSLLRELHEEREKSPEEETVNATATETPNNDQLEQGENTHE